ncbi:hypothetical protein MBLNU459_g7280t1 [Dothideomycetes sp. NU459]
MICIAQTAQHEDQKADDDSETEQRGRTLSRTTKRKATSDETSGARSAKRHAQAYDMDTGSNAFAVPGAVILQPTPPVSATGRSASASSRGESRGRTPSPTRQWSVLLRELAEPRVDITNTGHKAEVIEPDSVRELRRRLVRTEAQGVIPHQLKDRIAKADPEEADGLPDSAYTTMDAEGAGAGASSTRQPRIRRTWAKVKEIHRLADECRESQKDESAWTDVVRAVFALAIKDHDNKDHTDYDDDDDDDDDVDNDHLSDFQLNDIHTQSILRHHLPRLQSDPSQLFDRKTDLAIAFDPRHARVRDLRRSLRSITEASHMSDTYTSTVPLVGAVEIKKYGGNVQEAEVQLGIWHAAALNHQHTTFVRPDGKHPTCPPQIGWTIIGHSWNVYISWKDASTGNVTVRGPYLAAHGTTATYRGIFTLLSCLRVIFDWWLHVYWPAFKKCVAGCNVPSAP